MKRLSATLTALTILLFAHATTYDVRQYGAKGDGRSLDTPAINAAIIITQDVEDATFEGCNQKP